MTNSRATVCLCMIVKDEAAVIGRCLASVRQFVDHWVIVDTGSSDGTQQIIREQLKDIPGELFERTWTNFAHNRTEALGLARGRSDYVLVIDADETLEVSAPLPRLEADSYMAELSYGSYLYLRRILMRSALPWRYEGAVHEVSVCDVATSEGVLKGVRTVHHKDGARAFDPRTYDRDAAVLEAEYSADPNNPRTVFYLAQSHRDAGNPRRALELYEQRTKLGGWRDEVWYSLYQIARLRESLGESTRVVEQAYLAAVAFDPERAEPLYALGALHQSRFDSARARALFAEAEKVARPANDRLFIDEPIYDYKIGVDLAVACHRAGDFSRAIDLGNQLLRRPLPAEAVLRVIGNRRYSLDARFPRPPAGARAQRVRVLVIQERAGSETDSCLDSLTRQQQQSFDVTIVRNGSFEDAQIEAFVLAHEQFSLIRREQTVDFDTCVAETVAALCQPDEIVVALHAWDRLPTPDTLARWCSLFNDAACELAYGQFSWPSGVLGNAEPACDADDFERRGAALADRSPLAFNARLVIGQAHPAVTRQELFRGAGFQGTRFVDEVMTVLDEVATHERPASEVALPRTSAARDTGKDAPLISCLMVTHGRLALAKRAIQCFARQTYPAKELVIITDDDGQYQGALERYLRDLGLGDRVRVHRVLGERRSLGQLRNISIEQALGDVLCQWDDDDCYHPERLAVQAKHMFDNAARACLLTDHLQYFEADRVLTWIDWTLGGRSGRDQLLPGTVMFCRDARCRYPDNGPYCRQGEDSCFLEQLCDTVPVAALVGMGHLYVYTYHGRNTFSEQHHKNLRNFSLSAHELRRREGLIRQAIGVQAIAKPLRVFGRDGVAFALHGCEFQGQALAAGDV